MSVNPTSGYCQTCRFAYEAEWLEQRIGTDCEKPGDDGWVYECRRYPPAGRDAVNDGTGSTDGWPLVMGCDWCGEHQPNSVLDRSHPSTVTERLTKNNP